MYCTKCSNKLSDGDKFCEKCGQAVEETEKKKRSDEEIKKDLGETLKQIVDHLEFLGYKINFFDPESKEGRILVLAIHDNLGNLICHEASDNFVFFQITYNTKKKIIDQMYHIVNLANQDMDVCKVYLKDEDGNAAIKIESHYLGKYEKPVFGRFHELLENDQKRVFSNKDFINIFS